MSTDQPTPPGSEDRPRPDEQSAPPPPPPPPAAPSQYAPPTQQPGQPAQQPAYAPAPPPGPAGPPTGAAAQYDVGQSFSYGWAKFTQNLGPILLAMLVYFAVFAAVTIIWAIVFLGTLTATTIDPDTGEVTGGGGFFALFSLSSVIIVLVLVVLAAIMQAGIIRGALRISRGEPVAINQLFSTEQLGQIILASIIIGVANVIGSWLVVGGIVVSFFTQFTMFFIVDKKMTATQALQAGISFTMKNLVPVLLFFLLSLVAYVVGGLLCLIGLIVAVPVVILAQTYTYRVLEGETVTA